MARLLRHIIASTALALLLVSSALVPAFANESVKVGIVGGDSEAIWHEVQKIAAADGIDVQLVVFNDYTLPNAALDAGDIDLNAFQHQPYLDAQNRNRGYRIVPISKTIVSPIGLYSHKVKSVAEIKDGAAIGIPNDPTNGGRGLLLLQAQGLIKLKPGTGLTPTPLDIVENPKQLTIREIDAAQLPRSLDDLDAAVINTNYALDAASTRGRTRSPSRARPTTPMTTSSRPARKTRTTPSIRRSSATSRTRTFATTSTSTSRAPSFPCSDSGATRQGSSTWPAPPTAWPGPGQPGWHDRG